MLDVNDLTPNAPFNPLAELLQNNSRSEVRRIFGNVKLDYKFHFLPELTAVANIGFNRQSVDGFVLISTENPVSQPNGSFLGSESTYSNKQNNQLLDGYLAYKKEIGWLNLDCLSG